MKKLVATGLAIVMALTVFMAPATEMKAEAWQKWNVDKCYSINEATDYFSRVTISTPGVTAKLYAGLTWQQFDMDAGVRLIVNDDDNVCGPAALAGIHYTAAALGAAVVAVVDADLEMYVGSWSKDIVTTYEPIRVAFEFQPGWDTTKDYGVIYIKEDGSIGIAGDIDANPASITLDMSSFDTYAIVAAPQGTFNAYRVASPEALNKEIVPPYCKEIPSSISTKSLCSYLYDIGVVTDTVTAKAAIGDSNPELVIQDAFPGGLAKSALDYAVAQLPVRKVSYHQVNMMKQDYITRVEQTSQKLCVTITIPYNFPVYADYAVAVVDERGSAVVMRDIDANPNTVTINTDDFRAFAIIAGEKGAFDTVPYVY